MAAPRKALALRSSKSLQIFLAACLGASARAFCPHAARPGASWQPLKVSLADLVAGAAPHEFEGTLRDSGVLAVDLGLAPARWI